MTVNTPAGVQASDKYIATSDQQEMNFLTGNLFPVIYNELWQLFKFQEMKFEINFAFFISLTEPKDLTIKTILYTPSDF